MTNETRKRIWPVALMSLAVLGVLAAVVALSVAQTGVAQAHGCDTGTVQEQAQCDTEHENAGLDSTDPDHVHPTAEPTPTPVVPDLTAPTSVVVDALDNTMAVRWSAPQGYDEDATLTGYEITQTLYVQDQDNPIANTPPAMKMAEADETEKTFRGLSYSTYYTYTVAAVFNYQDADGNTMTMKVAADPVTMRTADSGGVRYPAETPPTMPMNLTASFNVQSTEICMPLPASGLPGHVALSWQAPSDAGQGAPPNLDPDDCQGDCTNVTPPHTGGDNAGITLLGADATITSYVVERRAPDGTWARMATVPGTSMSYNDMTARPDMTYEYRVRAVNSVGLMGAWSENEEINTQTTMTPPHRPTSLVATIKSPTAEDDHTDDVELQWDPSNDPAGDWRTREDSGADHESEMVAYCVQRKTASAAWSLLGVQPHRYSPDGLNSVLTQEYTDGDAPEGAVTYRVAAVFAHVELDASGDWTVYSVKSGPSPWNEATEVKTVSHVAPPQPLGNPSGLSATTGPFPGTASVSWTAAPNADAQWVWGHNYATGSGSYVASVGGDAGTANVTGLTSGVQYAFTVVAGQDAAMEGEDPSYSAWSNWSAIVTVE